MADWTVIPDSVLEVGKPIRAIDGRSLRDNAIAIAEGAPGAPRISATALGNDMLLGAIGASGTTANGFVGLDGTEILILQASNSKESTGNASNFETRFTSDNGDSWGSWQQIYVGLNLAAGQMGLRYGTFSLNLATGQVAGSSITYTAITGGSTTMGATSYNTSLTIPAGINGIQFRCSHTSGSYTVLAHHLGGSAP